MAGSEGKQSLLLISLYFDIVVFKLILAGDDKSFMSQRYIVGNRSNVSFNIESDSTIQ